MSHGSIRPTDLPIPAPVAEVCVCTEAICDPTGQLPIYTGNGVVCDGPCDAYECCSTGKQ